MECYKDIKYNLFTQQFWESSQQIQVAQPKYGQRCVLQDL